MFLEYKMIDFEFSDYSVFLKGWFEYLKNNGGLGVLISYLGDYIAPYMTLLALLIYLPFKDIALIKFKVWGYL